MVRSELGLTSDDEAEASEPPDALFWYPKDYVIQTWRHHQKYGTFPNGGAYNDLDPRLDEDWKRVTARYNWHFDQLRPNKDGESKGDVLGNLLKETGNPQSWNAWVDEK